MTLSVVPIHKQPQFLRACCDLVNSEWKRSDTARLRSLESSCDHLPVSLILIKEGSLIGHLKLSIIPSIKEGCFVESVVIKQDHRGQGYGTVLMKEAEKYCKNFLHLKVIYLSTKGQEKFYHKLGYEECAPISIYGSFGVSSQVKSFKDNKCVKKVVSENAPMAPPLPVHINNSGNSLKTYMRKEL
ncbi:N-alpha-acetyltransferase 80 [Anthonomus grandis grandis]|uniref:N-alpha-acetyltransferase 80 n=1 Tax=Anthonomus grandis grandis TaxID=2921223 RepID=UPI002165A0EA|nr:N-alpha-acetyltransferase 80 [Anthonomus grandis grandis]